MVCVPTFHTTERSPDAGPLCANAAPIFVNTLGVLDGTAQATAAIGMPAGVFHALVGLFLEHAFVVLAPSAMGVSQPVPLTLRP